MTSIPSFVKLLVSHFDTFAASDELVVISHRTLAPAVDASATRRDPHVPVLDLARIPGLVGTPNAIGISSCVFSGRAAAMFV